MAEVRVAGVSHRDEEVLVAAVDVVIPVVEAVDGVVLPDEDEVVASQRETRDHRPKSLSRGMSCTIVNPNWSVVGMWRIRFPISTPGYF